MEVSIVIFRGRSGGEQALVSYCCDWLGGLGRKKTTEQVTGVVERGLDWGNHGVSTSPVFAY